MIPHINKLDFYKIQFFFCFFFLCRNIYKITFFESLMRSLLWCHVCVLNADPVANCYFCNSALSVKGNVNSKWKKKTTHLLSLVINMSFLGCSLCSFLSFFVLSWFSKSLWTNCRGFRSPASRVVETDSWLRRGSSFGHFPPSQSRYDNTFFVKV